MSLFDKIKDVGKKAGAKIKEETSKELARMKDRKQAINMLKILRKSELTKFCREYGIEYDNSMSKQKIMEQIDYYGGRQVTTELVTDYFYSIRRNIPKQFVKETVEEVEIEQEIIKTEKVTTKVKKTTRTKTVTKIRKHLKNFKPIVSRNFRERNLEAQMVQALRMDFGNEKVNYQERAKGGRVDIVVDGKYAIELKVITSPSQLTQMVGQISNYSYDYEKVFVYLYDRKSQMKKTDVNNLLKKHIQHRKNVEIFQKR